MNSRRIDDPYKRIGGNNSYKAQRFDGKKSMIDDYTGGRIFSDSTIHKVNNAAQVDHVIPLDKVNDLYGDLPCEQLKEIANDTSNFAMTNGELNMYVKNRKMNHQVVAEQAPEAAKAVVENLKNKDVNGAIEVASDYAKTSKNMLKSELKASTHMAVNANGKRAANAANAIKDTVMPAGNILGAAKAASISTAGISAVVEVGKSLINGDDAGTCVNHVVTKSAEAAVTGAVTGAVGGATCLALAAANPLLAAGVAVVTAGTSALITSDAVEGAFEEIGDKAEDITNNIIDRIEDHREFRASTRELAWDQLKFGDVGGAIRTFFNW